MSKPKNPDQAKRPLPLKEKILIAGGYLFAGSLLLTVVLGALPDSLKPRKSIGKLMCQSMELKYQGRESSDREAFVSVIPQIVLEQKDGITHPTPGMSRDSDQDGDLTVDGSASLVSNGAVIGATRIYDPATDPHFEIPASGNNQSYYFDAYVSQYGQRVFCSGGEFSIDFVTHALDTNELGGT